MEFASEGGAAGGEPPAGWGGNEGYDGEERCKMADLNRILSQIKPCDTSKPYIFISYSSRDRETVWADVLSFQQSGYNIWLDDRNLDKTKDSWKEDALRAINRRRCQLLLFYVSAASLCSEPCLRELRELSSERTVTNHLHPVPFLAVDVEDVGDIVSFCDQVHMRLDDEIENEDEFEQKARTLREFRMDFFKDSNERVRIHPRSEPGRKGDYYEDIESFFPAGSRLSGPEDRPAPPPPAPDPAPPPVPPSSAAGGDLHTVKTLGTTDIKYNICTFGSAFDIGAGVPVTLEMGGRRYERKMHSTAKGRVDGMKKLYADHGLGLGDVLEARYVAAEGTIYLAKAAPKT